MTDASRGTLAAGDTVSSLPWCLQGVSLRPRRPLSPRLRAGVAAKLVRSDLRLPEPLYEALSLYLLLALGLKGGSDRIASAYRVRITDPRRGEQCSTIRRLAEWLAD